MLTVKYHKFTLLIRSLEKVTVKTLGLSSKAAERKKNFNLSQTPDLIMKIQNHTFPVYKNILLTNIASVNDSTLSSLFLQQYLGTADSLI